MDQADPDRSTLTKFKERMILRKRELKPNPLLADIVQTALGKGIRFGSIQVVDSTNRMADVNTSREDNRGKDGKGPADPDAQWGAKGKHTTEGREGTKSQRFKYFDGYKTHAGLNAENHMITTPGNVFDGHFLRALIQRI